MKVEGYGTETFLYLSGLAVPRAIPLGPGVELRPAVPPLDQDLLDSLCENSIDLACAILSISTVGAEFHIEAEDGESVAKLAWNTMWDAVLISAFMKADVICNLQSDVTAAELASAKRFRVTNYHLRGRRKHTVSDDEANWIEENLPKARSMLNNPAFMSAVHCLASYRWHSVPRAQLALLWSGIEGLFGIQSELVFRISLYASRFLTGDQAERESIFAETKKLYKMRSKAVHGEKIKGDQTAGADDSADLLQRLLLKCVDVGTLPDPNQLAP